MGLFLFLPFDIDRSQRFPIMFILIIYFDFSLDNHVILLTLILQKLVVDIDRTFSFQKARKLITRRYSAIPIN
jgi:hypothetical protein